LLEQGKTRPLTDQEKGWIKEYKTSDEFHLVFVMPYEEQEAV